jgi:hypothetical protein
MGRPTNEERERRLKDLAAVEREASGSTEPTDMELQARNAEAFRNPDAFGDAHGEIAKPKYAGEKVIVGCKIGVREISLQLTKMEELWENTQSGPRKIKEGRKSGPVVRIKGTAKPNGTIPEGYEIPLIVNGAALNFDVDGEWWDAWLEQNRLNPLVENGMIFAHKNLDFVKGVAKETSGQLSGLEPINPRKGKDPRVPRSTRSDVSDVETEESKAAKIDRAIAAAGR